MARKHKRMPDWIREATIEICPSCGQVVDAWSVNYKTIGANWGRYHICGPLFTQQAQLPSDKPSLSELKIIICSVEGCDGACLPTESDEKRIWYRYGKSFARQYCKVVLEETCWRHGKAKHKRDGV